MHLHLVLKLEWAELMLSEHSRFLFFRAMGLSKCDSCPVLDSNSALSVLGLHRAAAQSIAEHNAEDLKIIILFSCVRFLSLLQWRVFLWHAGTHMSVLIHRQLKVLRSFITFFYPITILHIHSLVRGQEQVCARMCVRCVQGALQKMIWYKNIRVRDCLTNLSLYC